MPSQHKFPPVAFRPPRDLRARLRAYADRTGQAVNAIITRAVTEHLDRHDPSPDTRKDADR